MKLNKHCQRQINWIVHNQKTLAVYNEKTLNSPFDSVRDWIT